VHRLLDPQCTSSGTQLYFEHYNIRIKDEIEARKEHRENFSELEIWYILYSIVKAVRMFEKIGISSGNLKTERILLNERGHLKVINTLSSPEEMEEGFTRSYLKRFYGTSAVTKRPKS
jgi:serine/threonine protein kinase